MKLKKRYVVCAAVLAFTLTGIASYAASSSVDTDDVVNNGTSVVLESNGTVSYVDSETGEVRILTYRDLEAIRDELAYINSNAVNTIDGFTCSGSTHVLTNAYLKNAKSVQVNYSDPNYDITPSYSLDSDAGKLTIDGLTDGVVVNNVIVYH